MLEIVGWVLSIALLLTGLAGVVLPALPGLPLMWLGILIHKLFIPNVLSWWTVVLLGFLVAALLLIEWLAGLWGAKLFGSSRWGMTGALIGGIVGLFFSLPGLILGPLLGAFLGEWLLARRKYGEAGKATVGVAVGILVSGVLKAAAAVMVLAAFVVDVIF